ncbi:glycosyltransferase [Fredinandcohnia sp. 179-A 10B2 NHS]|uniref:glycosyltransferase family protein n=1 Tax=Fredinandcohnia sp. 179-A 10B2 NHS TaxID=3235176 RepID=UPI0039A1FF90
MEKLKLLVLVNQFWRKFPKHKPKYEALQAIEKYAEVRYWYRNGNIHDILSELNFNPDFILHYDNAWGNALAPAISGLDKVDIPKGCIVIDIHFNPAKRREYFERNKIDLIFSLTKEAFIKKFPGSQEKFRWLPFSINPEVFKDWQLEKDIDYLLMGAVYDRSGISKNLAKASRGKYPFREEVLEKMRNIDGFIFHPHPGHKGRQTKNTYLNEKYARELNRSKIFFTCGSSLKYPVLKFFEAPACKTLLLAEPVPDILELGFEDGVNFVACDRMNFYEKALYYLQHEEERKRITENGYNLIHTLHTNEARAQQLIHYIKEYIENGRDK